GIFLVYDITSERSFQHIMKWASDVDEYAPEKVQKILVGNKSDDVEKRQVATEQGVKVSHLRSVFCNFLQEDSGTSVHDIFKKSLKFG
ncbi:Ras- protein Rab-15, partial [Goodea atripinnis]